MTAVFFNQQIYSSTQVPFDLHDRGLLLGDGLFETLRVNGNTIYNFSRHWQRLLNSTQELQITLNFNAQLLEEWIFKLVKANQLQHAAVRVTVTRGAGERGLLPQGLTTPTLIITANPWISPSKFEITTYIANTRRNEYSMTSRLKTLNYIDHVMAKIEAQQHQADDAILLNTAGHVVCASAANIFIVRDNQLYTPEIAAGALPGIVRSVLFDLALQLGYSLTEQILQIQDLLTADEVFITNSLVGILAVIKVNEHTIQDHQAGKLTCLLRDEYENLFNKSKDRKNSKTTGL